MEEDNDSILYMIQEILSLDQFISNEDSIMNHSLYERNPIKRVISENVKNALQTCKYKNALNKEHYTSCCIRQDDFLDDDDIIQLPCEHCFFPEPIIKWLTEESCACPICKKTMDSVELKKEEENTDYTYNFFNNYNFENTTFLDESFFNAAFLNPNFAYYNFLSENQQDNSDID